MSDTDPKYDVTSLPEEFIMAFKKYIFSVIQKQVKKIIHIN